MMKTLAFGFLLWKVSVMSNPNTQPETSVDVQRAREIWASYQQAHDVATLIGQTAGIDPVSGRIWFGESAIEVDRKKRADGFDAPIYCIRVGYDYYMRKGGRR
jgi:hypothetical protein